MRRLGQPPIDKECLDDTWVLSGHIVFDNFTYCEVFWWVHIVTRKHLRDAMERYPDAANEIKAWVGIVEAVRWHNFAEVHDMFKDADSVDGYVIFNIRRSRYRLITVVHYSRTTDEKETEGHVYIRSF